MFGRATNLGVRHAWLWRHQGEFGASGSGAPRVLVDVSAIIRHDAQTGIQRVVRAVWSELSRRSGSDFVALPVYATASHGYCYAPPDLLNPLERNFAARAVKVRKGDKFLGLDLSAHLLPKYRRQLRAWHGHGAEIHLVVYDLLPLQRPAWFTASAVNHFRKWIDVVAEEADQAICISNEVARQLAGRLENRRGRRRPRIGRLQLGADIAASVPSTGLCDKVIRAHEKMRFRPAVLMVGTVEPRKGYEAAIAAFDYLWRRRSDAPDLVIVGKAGWKTEKLQTAIRSHPEFGRQLQWFDRMSDEALCLLYEASRGLLMASRGEGWGLPLVEAAMHRKFVLARDLPVFHEQGLPNVHYFTDDSPEHLGNRLMEFVHIGEAPAPVAKLPTWAECVDGLLNSIGIAAQTAEGPRLRIAS